MPRFVLTANSPGEVATWLAPTVRALRRRAPSAQIVVFIVPCAFAAGTEIDVVRSLPEVDLAFGPQDYWVVAFGGPLPEPLRDGRRGAVLYLGGDLVHAARLARRLKLPALAYVERGSRWTKWFVELLVADEEARGRVLASGEADARVRLVGNLMVDAVASAPARSKKEDPFVAAGGGPVVAVFPGSRPFEISYSLPFFMRALELVRAAEPGVQVVISVSAFAEPAALQGRRAPGLEGVALEVEETAGGGWTVTTEGGVSARAVRGAPYDVMGAADVAVTLPGSNTAEMAAAGLPMIVVLPLNLAEKIPLPGAAQYVDRLPFVGRPLKRRIVRRVEAGMEFVAWPNRKAGGPVVPEVRGDLTPEDVADAVVSLLHNPSARRRMADDLRSVLGPPGAADRIAARMLAAAEGAGGGGAGGEGREP